MYVVVECIKSLYAACQLLRFPTDSEAAQELQTIFFLNCGAREDLPELLGLGEHVRAVVIDSHRYAPPVCSRFALHLTMFCQIKYMW